MTYYGALQIGRWRNTYYVYYEGSNVADRTKHIVKVGFKTKEDANKWIDNNVI